MFSSFTSIYTYGKISVVDNLQLCILFLRPTPARRPSNRLNNIKMPLVKFRLSQIRVASVKAAASTGDGKVNVPNWCLV